MYINECMDMNEVKIVKKCNHENIIKLYEIIHEQNNDVSYIFEYADTNLYEYMSSFKKNNQSAIFNKKEENRRKIEEDMKNLKELSSSTWNNPS